MVRHVLLSGAAMVPGLAALGLVFVRFGEGRTTLRRFAIAFVALLLVIAGVSAASETYRQRCPGRPLEWCEYNDSVGAMATIAVVFSIAAWVRAWMLYAER